MSKKRSDLYSIEHALIEKFPVDSVDAFISDIKNGITPSTALRNFIATNSCSTLDSSVIFDLLRRAYTGIDIGEISGLIHDSGYPFVVSDDMNDAVFDALVVKAYTNPSEW
jgi:hypothetical protein